MIALLCTCALPVEAGEVLSVRPWEFHSSFWMSLHQTLIADASASTPRGPSTLSSDEHTAWNAAVSAYRAAGGRGNITFAAPIAITTDALTQVADDATEPVIEAPLAEALKRAAPMYRAHWWEADQRANRFFIAYAAAMLREAASELVRKHEAVYRTAWPQRILVYVAPFGGPFGAYTMIGKAGGAITTMSSRDAGYQGLRALEMLLHESSHTVVGAERGALAAVISSAAKRHGVAAPRDLVHAIIFATSGELTRRLLADLGVSNYVPSSEELFTRVWPTYKAPIEKYWLAYVNGQGTLEDAIDQLVGAIH